MDNVFGKEWYKSKIFWVSLIAIIGNILAVVWPGTVANPQSAEIGNAIGAFIIIILRLFFTNEPIKPIS
jgi:hypothetical protein